jgi:hypothetical protein
MDGLLSGDGLCPALDERINKLTLHIGSERYRTLKTKS